MPTLALSFLEPSRLWWLLLPLAVVAAYLVAQLRRRGVVARFTDFDLLDEVAPERPRLRRHVPAALAVAGLVVLVLAIARPAVADEVPEEGAIVMLAMDTSLSMAAQDVSPDRIAAATEAAGRFLDEVPDGVKVGLVAFDGSATVVRAPAEDASSVMKAVESLTLGEGTAVGDAIVASVGAIDANREGVSTSATSDAPGAVIVLLSDGETTQGEPNDSAAALAAEQGIPVHTIAFGTDSGFVDVAGEVIPVPVNRDALAAVADETGGEYFPALTAEELDEIYAELGRTVTHRTEDREITDVFAAVALALLALGVGASLLWAGRVP